MESNRRKAAIALRGYASSELSVMNLCVVNGGKIQRPKTSIGGGEICSIDLKNLNKNSSGNLPYDYNWIELSERTLTRHYYNARYKTVDEDLLVIKADDGILVSCDVKKETCTIKY